jgi:hypothetical protein
VLIAAIVSVDPLGERLRPGTGAGFVVLVAFVLSFLAIRTSARLTRSVSWWPGGVESGGVHIHHLVWGIGLMLLCGFMAFAAPLDAPWWHLIAVGFGVGAGFTLDEFALWVWLEDVYWAEEGRQSVDAVVIAATVGGLLLLGFVPFSTDSGIVTIVASTIAAFAIAVVNAAKGKYVFAVVSMLVPVIGVVTAVRLAKPESAWGRRRYAPGTRKHARAAKRYARHTARYRRFQDRVAGAPTDA